MEESVTQVSSVLSNHKRPKVRVSSKRVKSRILGNVSSHFVF